MERIDYYCLLNSDNKRNLILDKETLNAVNNISLYIARDKRFEKNGFSLKKGLWIYGNFGSGKSQIMESYMDIKNFLKEKCTMTSCEDMNRKFLDVDKYSGKAQGYGGISKLASQYDIGVERIFDDLGEEEVSINNFGNKVSVMAYTLKERHKGRRNGVVTHITTNLTEKQVKEDYGERCYSRTKESFNFIPLGSKANSVDYRKMKL